MSYNRTPLQQALGTSLVDQIADTINKAAGYGSTIQSIVNDPYLPEIACYAGQLHDINAGKQPQPCTRLPPGLPGAGVGLNKVAPYMRAYVYTEQHPWTKPVALAALFGVPFFLGYLAGRR